MCVQTYLIYYGKTHLRRNPNQLGRMQVLRVLNHPVNLYRIPELRMFYLKGLNMRHRVSTQRNPIFSLVCKEQRYDGGIRCLSEEKTAGSSQLFHLY